jgi:hypothetical protein
MAASPSPWTCPSCDVQVSSRFCPRCGEEVLRPLELSLRSQATKLLHAATSIDGKLLRTVWRLVRCPGDLTLAYLTGQRKPYIAPFQLFLLANLLFFAVQSMTRTNIFGATLDSHLHIQDWRELAQAMVDRHLARDGTTLEAYAPVFDRAAVVNAKSLVVVMTLPFAGLLYALLLGGRRTILAHAVLALHLYTFLLLLFCIELAITEMVVLAGGPGLDAPVMDNLWSIFALAACAAWILAALRRVFALRGPAWIARGLVLALAAGALVPGYRFFVFLVTLQTT